MVIIKYIDGRKVEKVHRSNLTPTGIGMRNTSAGELRKVLEGDGRRLLVYKGNGDTKIIMPGEIRDILIHGKSIFIEDDKGHQCGVWCDEC